jgi:hypothetical protein
VKSDMYRNRKIQRMEEPDSVDKLDCGSIANNCDCDGQDSLRTTVQSNSG